MRGREGEKNPSFDRFGARVVCVLRDFELVKQSEEFQLRQPKVCPFFLSSFLNNRFLISILSKWQSACNMECYTGPRLAVTGSNYPEVMTNIRTL